MAYDPVIEYAIQYIPVQKIIESLLPNWKSGEPYLCPFHEENTPSFSLDLHQRCGVIGQCFGCGEKIQHLFDLTLKLKGKGKSNVRTWSKEARGIYADYVQCVPSVRNKELITNLLQSKDALNYLQGKRRRLTRNTIETSQLGYNSGNDRITIPIFDFLGNIIDIKQFTWKPKQKGPKCISYQKGTGQTRIYPIDVVLKNEKLFLVEGLWDALILNQHGIPAISFTNGANSFSPEDSVLLRDKKILISYDNDAAGKAGVIRVQEKLILLSGETRITCVSPPEISGKDITDWISTNEEKAVDYFKKQYSGSFGSPGVRRGQPPSFSTIRKEFYKHFYIEDELYIDAVFSALLANRFFIDPVWFLVVGPPGGLKTEVIRAIERCSYVREISKITGKTLLSGSRQAIVGGKEEALIYSLHKKIITHRDFNTMITASAEIRQPFFDQLRQIHDGKIEADFGTGVHHRWEGHVGFLGGTTNVIDSSMPLQSVLGERFILYRLQVSNREIETYQAISNLSKTIEIRLKLSELCKDFLEQFSEETPLPFSLDDLSKKDNERLYTLGELVAHGRVGVIRSGSQSVVECVPEPEHPTRISRALALIGMGLCILTKKKEFDHEVWKLLSKVSVSSIVQLRKQILLYIAEKKETQSNLLDIADCLRMEPRSIIRHLRDMCLQGIELLEFNRERYEDYSEELGDEIANEKWSVSWKLSEKGRRFVKALEL